MGIKTARRITYTYLLMVLLSGSLFGGETGKITGKVIDKSNGAPLIGANVLIEGTNLGAATDAAGEYYIINIPPGDYTIRASYVGFRDERKTDVLILVDKTIYIDYELESQAVEGQEVVVNAFRPDRADPDLTATKQTYDIDAIESLPGITDVTDILNLQADVDRGHFRGGRDGEAVYLISGANIMNPLTGARTFAPITIGLEQVEVHTSGFSAEYGNVQSGVINMMPKEGWGDWKTRIEVSQTNDRYDHWGGSVYSNEINPFIDTLLTLDGWVTGIDPVSGAVLLDFSIQGFDDFIPQQQTGFPTPPPPSYEDSLHTAMLTRAHWLQLVRQIGYDYAAPNYRSEFSTGGSLSENTALFVATRINSVQPTIPTPERDIDIQITANLVHRIGFGDKVSVSYNYNRDFENDLTSNFLRWFEITMNTPKVIQSTHQIGLNWNHVVSQSTFMEFKISQLNTLEEGYIEILADDEYSQIYSNNSNWRFSKSPSGHTGGKLATTRGDYATKTTHLTGNITSQIDNRNLLKSGLELTYYDLDIDHRSSLTNPASMRWEKYHEYPFEGAIYAQDKMEYEGFIANLGLRYDFYNFNNEYYANQFSPYRNPDFDPANPDAGGFYDAEHAAKKDSKFTGVLQPRVGFSFPVSDKTVLHLNYGVFTQRPPYEYIFVHRLKMDANPNIDRLGNVELEPEKTISYDMGVVRVLPWGFYLDLSAYYKNVSNLIQSAQYIDQDGFVYNTFDNREYADIHGFQVALDKKYGLVRGNLRYNWESATGQASSPLGAADQVAHYEGAPEKDHLRNPKDIFLDFNRLHKFVATFGLYIAEGDGPTIMNMRPLSNFSISTIYRHMSGRPFTWDASGLGLRFNQRTPDERQLTARLEKAFLIGGSKITAWIEGYNLLNEKVWHYSRTFREDPANVYRARYMDESEDVLTETEFAPYVTRLEPYLLSNSPRSYRFGLKFDF